MPCSNRERLRDDASPSCIFTATGLPVNCITSPGLMETPVTYAAPRCQLLLSANEVPLSLGHNRMTAFSRSRFCITLSTRAVNAAAPGFIGSSAIRLQIRAHTRHEQNTAEHRTRKTQQ